MNLNHIAKKPFFDLFYRTPCMPAMMRAAMYDATLSKGAVGTVALQNQLAIAQSKELSFAVKQVEEIMKTGNHITNRLSKADLLQLGGYAAVEYCGGPAMIFECGREDVETEGDAIQHSAETYAGSLVVQGISQANLAPEEFVALMGSFTLGFCGDDKKGASTRWTLNPYVFDNTYFQELLLRDQSKYYRTEADLKLVQNASLKTWVDAYAQDEEMFFRNYAKAHVKISELGQQDNLMSEFQSHRMIDGGYQEESRMSNLWFNMRTGYSAYMVGQTHQEYLEENESEEAKQIEDK